MQDWLRTLRFAHQPTQTLTRVRGKPWQTSSAYPALDCVCCATAWHTVATRHGSTWPLTLCYTAAQHSTGATFTRSCRMWGTQTLPNVLRGILLKLSALLCLHVICIVRRRRAAFITAAVRGTYITSLSAVVLTVKTPVGLFPNRPIHMCVGQQVYEAVPVGCLTCHWGRPPQPPAERWTAGRACWSSAAARLSGGPPPLHAPPGSPSLPGWLCAADDSAGPKPQCKLCCYLQIYTHTNIFIFTFLHTMQIKAKYWNIPKTNTYGLHSRLCDNYNKDHSWQH